MVDTIEIRTARAESDIETLRKTQSAMLDRYDQFYKVQQETLEITGDNRCRLTRLEDRMKSVEDRQDRMEERLQRMEDWQVQNEIKEQEERHKRFLKKAREGTAALHDNRRILLAIADHYNLSIPKPDSAE